MENVKAREINLDEELKNLLSVPTYKVGLFTLDVTKRELIFNNEATALTKKELYLILLLGANINKFLDRSYILKTIWSKDGYLTGRSMDVYLCKIRKLLSKDARIDIVNTHGKGFRMTVN